MGTAVRQTVRVVAVDDDPNCLDLVRAALEQEGTEILVHTDPELALADMRQRRPDIVLLDLNFPNASGMDVLDEILRVDPGMEVALLTGDYSTESAVEAIKKGACDYLTKPISVEVLRQRIGKLIEDVKRRQRAVELERELLDTCQFEGIVGRSPAILEVFAAIRRIAPHFQVVVVTGPTGTGKELVAKALHRLSPRAEGPFAVCNCSAIVETLTESELFGHVKGSFTGAIRDQVGVFESAQRGTVFLDEIGDLPLPTQAKLLRVLQNFEIQRVGFPTARKVDVRVIAATNQPLLELVDKRQFRQDLYYRLAAIELSLPPLSERREDIPLLVQHFVGRFATMQGKNVRGLTRRAQGVLARHAWPGNVRELENVLAHACMMASGELIDVSDFPERLLESTERGAGKAADGDQKLLPLEEIERRHIRQILEAVDGNRIRAARVLGIGRTTLHRWLKRETPQ